MGQKASAVQQMDRLPMFGGTGANLPTESFDVMRHLCNLTTAFTCRAGCKERDVSESRNAGPVKCNGLVWRRLPRETLLPARVWAGRLPWIGPSHFASQIFTENYSH